MGVLDLWSDDAFNAINDQQRALYMKDEIHPYKCELFKKVTLNAIRGSKTS